MKATEALAASSKNAAAIAKQKELDRKKRCVSEKRSRSLAKQKFLERFAENCQDHINSAVEEGETTTKVLLSVDNHDHTAGDHVYGEKLYQDYLKNAKFGKEVLVVMHSLRRKGYKVEVEGKSTEHDTSAAYMNSGGNVDQRTLGGHLITILLSPGGRSEDYLCNYCSHQIRLEHLPQVNESKA